MSEKAEVLVGTLDLMVLQTLEREKQAWDQMAGIIQTVLHSKA